MDDLTNYLVCFRVGDKSPNLKSEQDTCSTCGEGVWRAYSNPDIDFTVVCSVCALEMMNKAEAKGEAVEVRPPTPEQLKDIEEYDKRKQN